MKTIMKIVLSVLLVAAILVGMFGAAFGLTWIGIEWRGFFGPKRAAVEREIYEETPSFVQGKILDLSRYRHEWMRTNDPTERKALESLIRQQMVQLNPESIRDRELREFYESIR